jgi:cysteinyl-tRNA synthetase
MDDDFNTPDALAALQSLAGELNRAKSASEAQRAAALAAELRHLGGVLGVLRLDAGEFFRKSAIAAGEGALSDETIDALIAARRAARRARDFKESDRIRNELAQAGVLLEDKPDGTTGWRRS